MTHLRVEQNTITENVTSNVIHKLYETAKVIIDNEELNEVEESQVSLRGNLQVPKAYGDEVDWLEAKFPNLHINVTGSRYIKFKDNQVLNVLLANGIGDGTGVTEADVVSVTNLNTWFKDNTSITSFDELQKFTGLTEIAPDAFSGCTNLGSISFPSTVTMIRGNAFENCKNINIDFSKTNIATVGGNAFKDSSGTITNLQNVSKFETYAFLNCTALQTLELKEDVYLGMAPFVGCTELQSVIINGNISFQNLNYARMFEGCTSLTSVTIKKPILELGASTFVNCSSLETLDLSNVQTLYPSTVKFCSKLKTLIIGNNTTIIPHDFFTWSGNAANVTLGTSVQTLEENCLTGTIATLTILATTPPTDNGSGLKDSCVIYVPASAVDTYKAHASWSSRADRIFAISE